MKTVTSDDLATLRWYLNAIREYTKSSEADSIAAEAEKFVADLLGEPVEIPVPPPVLPPVEGLGGEIATLNKPLLTYPALQMKTRGKFPQSHPRGLIVHFTAGRYDPPLQAAKNTIADGIKQGYAYWMLDTDGDIIQTHPLSEWGYHAGVSSYPGLGTSVSQYLLGLEIANPGTLSLKDGKYMTYFNMEVAKGAVVHTTQKRYPNETLGYFMRYTSAQEDALIDLCLMLKWMKPDIFSFDYVLGHDEVATPAGRKDDPGGALSMGMPALRTLLKDRWASYLKDGK